MQTDVSKHLSDNVYVPFIWRGSSAGCGKVPLMQVGLQVSKPWSNLVRVTPIRYSMMKVASHVMIWPWSEVAQYEKVLGSLNG